ncbi:hypothetical protein PENFLA_c057G06428 [Penicillium flavigenum]|uniref:Mutanase n=1 Tax=Penicillium flavigenum TaxID=254877 RepID=A0A1V6SH24_9EURO|nr:hypothetical protein PENFLA_c057G06428 [Penicillium flavigenum]
MRLFVAWVTALLLSCRVQAAAVFAHFMVTNSANYTSSDWENDMKLAQDAHIDAFALNMAYNDPTNMKALAAAFAAADSVGFKLFFSFDYAGNGDWPKNDVVDLITQYSAHSSYFFYKGKAFVSTFEGPGRADDWPLIKLTTNCFFVPSWSSLRAKPAIETGVVDGLFSWAGWPWGDEDMNTYIDASYIQYLAGMPAVVSIRGNAETVGWSSVPGDDIGVYYSSVAFDGRTGPVTVSLIRGSTMITTIEGKAISGSCTDSIQNWNAWVGSATTGSTVSARTKVELSDQKCINGTGASNFAGLCKFAYTYNYCPLGACACTKMGIGHKKPNSTGVLGYPIAGEGASYSGLCNFDCNLGLYPPSACGTVEVPLSTPSVSPFLPPACTSGTGVGNLGGLCDFACTHGFCPINACTCTGQGAVNVMSPTTDVTGEAAPGQDSAVYGPLCEYTCQRGYCPEGACVAQSGSSTGSGSGSGSDSDSDDLHVAASVADSKSGSNIVTGVGPLNIIVAPSTLTFTTTFSIESLVTPIEVAWTTTKTVTISGQPTVTTTVTRTVQTTTFAIPEIRTTQIPWWNWNITATNVKDTSTTLFPSFALDPIVFADKPDVPDMTYTATASRTLYPPPWPWSTSSLPVVVPTPTIKFTQGGPPGPTCTSGCGTKCTSFCHTPCLLNCDDPKAHESWKDPADPDPPASHSKCTGPECQNGECTGSNCQKKGCTGSGCDSGVCLDDSCKYSGCIGGDCGLNGSCDGPDCKTVGCEGADCNKSGGCFGFDCISIGCIGIDCTSSTGECTGPKCHMVSCTGPNCQDGVCTGPGCESEDDDCEAREADVCTETVYSTIVTPASTYTTETSTSCETITACSAEASTTTTTIEEDSITAWVGYYNPDDTLDTSAASSLSSSIEAMFSSIYATTTTTSTTSKPSTTSMKPTSVPIGGDCGSSAQCKGDCPKGKILQCADYGSGPSCTCITDQNVPPYGTMCQRLKDCTDAYYCALGDSMVCEERDYSNGEPVCLCIKGSGS